MTDYYVDGSAGADINAGTSEGNAWATITRALDSAEGTHVIAGDTLYVKSSATYSEDIPLDVLGTNTAPIRIVGYDSTITDNGKVTISGTTSCLTVGATTGARNTKFENFIFTGSSTWLVNFSNTEDSVYFQNCDFTSAGGGIQADNYIYFFNCTFSSITDSAISMDSTCVCVNCRFSGMSGGSVVICNGGVFLFCEFFNNAGVDQITFDANIYPQFVVNCTFDGENNATGNAIDQSNAASNVPLFAINNIFYDFGTAVSTGNSGKENINFIGYNLINSNTTDYGTGLSNTLGGDVTTAPAFTNEAGDDYSLTAGSPAVDTGTDAADIP